MRDMSSARRIVVKVGSSTLTHESGKLNIRRIEKLTRTICDLQNMGKEMILVSSGAIAVGVSRLGIKKAVKVSDKQAAAAVGQCELMYIYDRLFAEYGHTAAQLLLTKDIMDNEVRKGLVLDTFNSLLGYGAIPVVNENDSVSVEEIHEVARFGDNDTLSAIVASLTSSDLLILLSDIDGLYDDNPHSNPDARLIPYVDKIDDEILALAGGAGSSRGTGGMVTKLNAAKIAAQAGVKMVIANGENPGILYDIVNGHSVGTLFDCAGKDDSE